MRTVSTAIIYARVSLDVSGRGRSVAEQIEECRRWADSEGWQIVQVYQETGSASRYAHRSRTVWLQVLEAISRHEADILLTWEASRAGRDLAGYAELRDACQRADVQLGYSGVVYDLSSRDARFRTGLDALLAEDEAARTSERVKRAMRASAFAGRVHGKHLYGYRRVYDEATRQLVRIEPEPGEAEIVREIFSRMLHGEGTYTIAADLNRRNVPPRRPNRIPDRSNAGWTTAAVREVALERPAYAGLQEYQGQILPEVEVMWPALIDRQQWLQLRQRFDAMPKRNPAEWKIAHLLTGIARCEVCGAPLIAGHQNRGRAAPGEKRVQYKSYVCRGMRAGSTAHVTVAMHALDDFVTDVLVERLSQPDALLALTRNTEEAATRRMEIDAEIQQHQDFLENVAVAAAQTHDIAMLIQQRGQILPLIERLRSEARSLAAVHPGVTELMEAESIRGTWQTWGLEQRRAVVASVMVPWVARAQRPGQRNRVHERVRIEWV